MTHAPDARVFCRFHRHSNLAFLSPQLWVFPARQIKSVVGIPRGV
ncbi:hypothetical protein [Kamptonema formosum]|nr:hypothetical protein [Oscillatoria sp. PCC 10802]